METTPLRQFLKKLCHDLHWEYAVFWRLKHQSKMVLTWDDGYCNYPKPRESVENMPSNVHLGESCGVSSFYYEDNAIDEFSLGYSVELAVASMSCLLYSLGEGHVGRVASSGKHCWMFADELDSKLLHQFQYQEELHLHFAVGIKTILLVPVMPHGVLQLGSLQKVNEYSPMVAHIRDMFNVFQWSLEESTPPALNRDFPDQSSSLTPLLEELASERSCSTVNYTPTDMKQINSLSCCGFQVETNNATSIPDMNFQLIGQNNLQVQGNNTDIVWNAEIGELTMDSSVTSFLESQLSDVNRLKRMEPDSSSLDMQFFPQWGSTELLAAHANMDMDSFHFDYMIDQQFGEEAETIGHFGFINFPAESELHKTFGSAAQESASEYLLNTNISGEDVHSSTNLVFGPEFTGRIDPSVVKAQGFTVNGGDADKLLDVMISSMHDGSGEISSNVSNSIISSGKIGASSQTQSASRCSVLGENDSEPWNSVNTGFVTQHEKVLTRSPTKSSFKSNRSNLIDEEQKKFGCSQSRRSTKLSQTGQKKARPCDGQRARPRDRQLIQERVKELRELVPNGAKCSIDSLLDHTVKHMLFLRSVTNRAENLKRCLYTEAGDRRNRKSYQNQGQENGASWAFELGSQVEVCPIVVKDLDQSGHMLIEMLCEETDLFLEIAQVIRRLELTIVKGAMEYRSDKSWAHFIVEASTGFRRMDIFWPLMQLLQRNSSISTII